MKNVESIILDLDGVITQTAKVHARAWKKMFDEYRKQRIKKGKSGFKPFDIEKDYPEHLDGKPRYEGVRDFLESREIELPYGHPADDPEKETVCGLGNRKNIIFLKLIKEEGAFVYNDALEMLHKWKRRGKKLAVVSSSKNCSTILEKAGLKNFFEVQVDGVLADELGLAGKPAPDTFLYAAKELSVDPSDAAVIEDAPAGIRAGKNGDFAVVVWIVRKNQDRSRPNDEADMIVNNLKELDDQTRSPLDLPSALEHFDRIKSKISDRKLFLFLDYDGTLTPIVQRPEMAKLSGEMRNILKQVSQFCDVAVVSGRDRADVKQLVGLNELIYAGSHGFDITGPHNLHMEHEKGVEALPDMERAQQEIQEKTSDIDGVQVERKMFSVAVHYRNVPEDYVSQVKEIVAEALTKFPRLKKSGGKMIVELQPDVEWHKGKALIWILRALQKDPKKTVQMYIGDDLTDENAFEVLQEDGIGILVGDHDATTFAKYRLENVDEVRLFLSRIHKLFREKDHE